MSDMTRHSSALNQAAAHDGGLYDPSIHDNQVVALYDTDAQARAAQQVLVQAGFPTSAMHVMARNGAASSTTTADASGMGYQSTGSESESAGIWASIKSLFLPEEDRTSYRHAIDRGHAMLVVTPDHSMDRHHLLHVMESTDPLDFDAKLEEWRQSGYDSSSAMTAATQGTTTTGMMTTAPETPLPPSIVSPAPLETGYPAATVPAPTAHDSEESIKVMEERRRAGKREVAAGAVRIRSYIAERSTGESVHLHEEGVTADRTPVDCPATAADSGASRERTIEARVTSGEAVISKEARVVEEFGSNKPANDRVETVHDTVPKTEVEIEGADSAAMHGTLAGITAGNPNATPGATTSGANSPRK